jgi:hypothetical protein
VCDITLSLIFLLSLQTIKRVQQKTERVLHDTPGSELSTVYPQWVHGGNRWKRGIPDESCYYLLSFPYDNLYMLVTTYIYSLKNHHICSHSKIDFEEVYRIEENV